MVPGVLDSKSPSPHRHAYFFLCSLFILLSTNTVTLSSAQASNRSEDDRQALLCFKSGLSGNSAGVLGSWSNESLNFCNWQGVTCSTALPIRVVSLELRSVQLRGKLSSCIANLTSLVKMDLSNNSISGNIPDEIGSLPGLQTLMLSANRLEGNIPPSFGMAASNNSLLTTLILLKNNLSGEIPASLFNGPSKLVVVDLRSNYLSGVIPYFHKMASLQFLGLTGNLLSGSIPASLGNISSLTSILLAQNNLRGPIPETLGQIPKLNILDLSYNRLSGNVPDLLYNVSSLISFNISNNRLAGKIPSDIGRSLPNLVSLIMRGNAFTEEVPASLNNISMLQVIDLSSNSLRSSVPSLGSLGYLNQLLLGSNKLETEDWAFLTSLTNCRKLLKITLDGNALKGRIIPSTIGNLTNLVVLALSMNRLSGEIPSTIGNLPQLNKLYLDDNMISGHIPASLAQCTRLAMLNLSVNNLDGSIPSEILSISSLSLGLDLSNNNLKGTIPPQIGKLINLGLLNVSSNKLSGEIPSELGQCVLLSSLQMEGNMLSGVIPQSLNTLKSIQQMDLSENNLSGYIPDFFENFKTLYHLNLSYNKLEGPIPTGGIFTNSNAVMLEGNKGLCQQIDIFALPICPITSSTKRKINGRLLLITVPPVTIALLSFLCVVATIMKGRTTQPSESYRETMKKVSYGDILKATNWFSPINRISSSHTASVYIGRFQFDTDLVAIKVFHLDEQGSLNSFFTECEVLKHTRHRNLVQAITLCSTVDFENNEFKALVYEFMANGSLDMWIHPRLHQRSPRRVLSLGQRISIAADVASALDYMHNQLTPPLIHCDLKPSNVLLDYDMTSRIGDFGSAKFLSSSLNSTPEGLVGASGTIGYIAPEYGMGCKISTGGDVYGFGVLLLEMLTAKRPTDRLFGNDLSLHKYVDLAFPNKINEILDPQMPHEDVVVSTLCMQRYIIPLVEIGLMCSMESPKDRPGMQDVCAKLEAIKEAFVETF
ncbi:hypothetical protein SORBI_3006G030700 [Sorghum bicolor]|uniref:Receptor kinase-like protein Xa21 n=1 Tax=Sorghum bicolor TaxID=4558 RepID=A0A1B6PJS1_SORBI|nr:hypothetical protein SORBI_3006G030700 [Sorghum bicolor]